MIVLADAENLTIVSSFVWTKHRTVTQGQTDRQNRSSCMVHRSALLAMWTRCKNGTFWACGYYDV